MILSYLSFLSSFTLAFVFEMSVEINTIVPQERVQQQGDKPNIKNTIFTSDEPSCCTICLEDFEEGGTVKETNCGHFYHKNCMETLLNNKIKNCPVCRANLYEKYDVIV